MANSEGWTLLLINSKCKRMEAIQSTINYSSTIQNGNELTNSLKMAVCVYSDINKW